MTLNLADLFEAVAAAVGEREAVVCGDDRLTYAELDERADRLAEHLVAAGLSPGDHVGIHMLNGVEFVESLLGLVKARLVPINVNYRYTERELAYLYDNADLAGLIVGADFTTEAAAAVAACETLRHVVVHEQAAARPAEWPAAVSVADYEQAIADASGDWERPERSDDDLYVLYTGGTTGMPKGVMWRHEDFYYAALSGGDPASDDTHDTPQELAAAAQQAGVVTYVIAPPLMHGAASYTLFTALFMGGKVVLIRRFDPHEVLRAIQDEQAMILTVVGDAMARPIVDALEEADGGYDLSSMFVFGSGGALLSPSTREALLAHKPDMIVRDNFGASESGNDGQLEVEPDGTMRLAPNPRVTVVDDDLRPLEPGSDHGGWVARRGHVPVGYYKDEEKTARTFPVIDGERWAILGDVARLEADGSVVVHGRGSGVINTGGEKVFPEEVEAALKAHPAVMDVLVAAVPDERFGQCVGAVVQIRDDVPAPSVEELRDHCRDHIAGYKVPAVVELVDEVQRSPSGKADYRWALRVLSPATSGT